VTADKALAPTKLTTRQTGLIYTLI